jgi:ribosomal protein S18 acetylase RimI-like enzyme
MDASVGRGTGFVKRTEKGNRVLIRIERSALEQLEEAYAIVQEYYEAIGVVVREDAKEFAREYFGASAGIWLANEDGAVVGCIALRPLPEFEQSGEVKRLYVKPVWRGQHIADRLLEELENYAVEAGYRTLYLDTKDDLITAIRFYHGHGYEDCERYNENPQATIFMRKDLAPSASLRAGS